MIIRLLLSLGVFLFASSPAMANDDAAAMPEALKRLQAFLGNLQTLEADFIQRVVEVRAGVPAKSNGHISTAKPGRFRWDYQTPNVQTIVSDGQTIWFHEPDLEQVTVSDASRLNDTPAVLLSSGTELQKLFTWEVFTDKTLNVPSVRLFPRKSGTIQEIVLTLHPSRDELLKLITLDSLGHTSLFYFQNMHINQPIPAERFQFEMPPDVDIIQDHPE